MERIDRIEITFQARTGKRAWKNVIRKYDKDGPYRPRMVEIPVNIETGPGTNANIQVRRLIAKQLQKTRKGEELFYVRAHFEKREGRTTVARYFKTIVARSAIPVQFRRL